MKKATAKSLTKTAVLDASDKPEDQDKARERRVKMDFASWRKQTKAGKVTHQEEVGISSAAEMKKAQKEAELRKKEQDAVRKEKEALKKEEVVNERLGGRGYSRKAAASGIHKTSGDWPDSDRGEGNKAARRAGKKVEKKSPTYLAHVHNKEEFVGEGKLTSVKATTYGMPAKERQALIDKERERQGVKPKPTKEEVQLERALDTFEKGEKERVVKGMKKDSKGLKKRYGKDWKSVMYATATKRAKEAGDTSKSDKRYAYEAKEIGEAKVDAGKSADEKATARNQRNNPKKGDKGFRKFATSAFIRRKEGQSLAWGKDSAASELRRQAHAARRGVKEETIDEKFATQYKDKGKLSKTDAPGSRHDHTHDVDPRMADYVPTKKVRKSSKAETRANVLKFDMKKEETIHELNRYEKETGKSSGPAGSYRGGVNTPRKGTPTKKGGSSDKLVHFGKGLKRSAEGRPTGQTRRSYDKRGEEGNTPTPVEKIKKYLDAKRAAKADPSQGRYPPGSRKD